MISLSKLFEGDQGDDALLISLKEASATADAAALAEEGVLCELGNGI